MYLQKTHPTLLHVSKRLKKYEYKQGSAADIMAKSTNQKVPSNLSKSKWPSLKSQLSHTTTPPSRSLSQVDGEIEELKLSETQER